MAESKQLLEAIVDTSGDGIISADAERRITGWNPSAERILGYRPDEAGGQPLTLIVPERFRQRHADGFARAQALGETRGKTLEVAALHKSGTEVPIELSLSTGHSDGEQFFSAIIRDITERKSAEEKICQINAELADKNEVLEGLSAKLSKYLSPQVYDSIFAGKTDVQITSDRKPLTVFFSDIQGFTELTDRLEPEPVCRLLNGYLSNMSDIALEHGGTIDKFMGDAIMIFFGDPDTRGQREDALACARMALAMRQRIRETTPDWKKYAGSFELHVRTGINTGYCTVGNFGSSHQLDYTIVGLEVNTASRLESSAGLDQIQISEATYQLIKDDFECRPVGELSVKGLAYPINTFELIGPADSSARRHEGDLTRLLRDELAKLSPTEIDAARKSLSEALASLERRSGDRKG